MRETIKNQFFILFILCSIFFCQKLIRTLSAVTEGIVPVNLVLYLLLLDIPEMLQLIFPLSVFLGLLVTLHRLCIMNESIAIYACGFGNNIFLYVAIILSIITAVISIINTFWICPLALSFQNHVLLEIKSNVKLNGLIEGQFQLLRNNNLVLFVTNIKGKELKDIFLVQLNKNNRSRYTIVVANSGYIDKLSNGSQIVILKKGTYYEGNTSLKNFFITDFSIYQTVINFHTVIYNNIQTEQMTLWQLLNSHSSSARAEFHWKLTLIVSIFIMAIIVVPLSINNQNYKFTNGILLAMIFYLIFFLLQTSVRFYSSKGKIHPALWVWLINLIYFFIGLILNILDTVTMRIIKNKVLNFKRLI